VGARTGLDNVPKLMRNLRSFCNIHPQKKSSSEDLSRRLGSAGTKTIASEVKGEPAAEFLPYPATTFIVILLVCYSRN
jgi:hypothetical protein